MNSRFLIWLVQQALNLLEPLTRAASSEDMFSAFLKRFGWDVAPGSFHIADVLAQLGILDDAGNLADALDTALEPSDDAPGADAFLPLLASAVSIFQDIRPLSTGNVPAGIPAQAWADFAQGLFDELLCEYLESFTPALYASLLLSGVVNEISVPAGGAAGRVDFVRRAPDWNALTSLGSHPVDQIRNSIGWPAGGPVDVGQVLAVAARLLALAGLPMEVRPPRARLLDAYYAPANPLRGTAQQVSIIAIRGLDDTGAATLEVTLDVLPIPPSNTSTASPDGFVAAVGIAGAPQGSVFWPYSVELLDAFAQDDGIRLELHGGSGKITLASPGTPTNSYLRLIDSVGLTRLLLGSWGSNRIELDHSVMYVGAVGDPTDPDIIIGTELHGLRLTFDAGDADGFLQSFLGTGEQVMTFDLEVTWSKKTGVGFKGQGQFQATIPLHVSVLDVVNIDTLVVDLQVGAPDPAAAEVSVSGSLVLGPVAATVDRIGILLRLMQAPAGGSGLLGDLDLAFGFKPPRGLGLVVDAGAVVGGGYIFFDPAKGQYAGALELAMESIQIKATGVLTTKMPDGSPGFSFLIIVSTEFTPMQLGFGFTLNGVGGLAGINRTMILDALRAGLKAHALNSVLFPVDPVQNAAKIITDVTTIFPPADGRYVFAPVIEIGWGSPTLVTGELGIVIELPSPVRLALLGLIKAAIPAEDEAIILLHIDVLGAVDFGLKKLAIDASIYDSYLAGFDLLGDMALRLNWGGDALFILSAGGLHPQFQPPPEFPKLARLTVSLGSGDNPRLALEAYLAVTSNTLQFGAHLELYASGGGFSVHGYLGFDALFIFSPFHFVVEMRAGVQLAWEGITLLGIDLRLKLSGPTPWAYDGTASIDFLFFSVDVHISGSFGGGTAPELPPAPVMTPLLAALGDRRSWSSQLPPDTTRAVTLMSPKPDDTSLYVHPRGTLTMAQSVVPLDTPINKFGGAVPSDGDFFTIAQVKLAGTAETPAPVLGQFAPAQYNEMPDADKLAARSFVSLPAGVAIGAAGIETGSRSDLNLEYDVQIIDDLLLPARIGPKYQMLAPLVAALAGQSAAASSLVRRTGNAKYVAAGTTSPISNSDVSFVVAGAGDLRVSYAITPGAGANEYQACAALAAHLHTHPEDHGRYQVIFAHEAVA